MTYVRSSRDQRNGRTKKVNKNGVRDQSTIKRIAKGVRLVISNMPIPCLASTAF